MKLLAFAASHRPESLNYKLVSIAASQANSEGVTVDLAQYSEFDMPLYNDTMAENPPAICRKFAERCKDVDGIMISLPEYNWSFPASLKNIIDWTSIIKMNPLYGKTAFLMSATTGSRGGIVGLQQFKSPLEALHMHVFHKVFPLPHADKAFNEKENLADKKQQELFFKLIKDYIIYTKKLSHK